MIAGNIQQLGKSRAELPFALYEVLRAIKDLNFSIHQDGQKEVNGVIYKTFTANTDLPEKRTPETHKDFIDIQFVISGNELVEFGCLGDTKPHVEKPEDDNYFYDRSGLELNEMKLTDGDFVIFFPWDIHSPLCHKSGSSKVRKIVAKVPVSSL
ncbi:TPA: YhcH/YjgK/YiaL family protein [Escherichia coli]|nr:YhcH/YjgK/YiaL family protein [Escherichia coli]